MLFLCFLFLIYVSIKEARVIMDETTTITANYNATIRASVPCSTEESQTLKCLNGGRCFKPTADSLARICQCPDDYDGENCENRVLPIFDTILANKVYLILISLTLVSAIVSLIVLVSLAIKKRRSNYTPWTEERQTLR